jgi:hypothetical protein
MADKAYIGLNEDHCWTIYYGDGSADEEFILAVGGHFEPGEDIRQVMNDLLHWAEDNGYVIVPPRYSKRNITLEELIEPEIYEEVSRSYDDSAE